MKFNLEDYADERHVMHCPEEWMAEVFCDFLHNNGREWCDGVSYLTNRNYDRYKEDTAYDFNLGRYCNIDYYKRNGWRVLEFADFDFGADNESLISDNLDSETIDMFFSQFPVN